MRLEREQQAIDCVNKFYLEAKDLFNSKIGFTGNVYLHTKYKKEETKFIVPLRPENKDLVIKLFTIHCVANGEASFGTGKDIDYILSTKRLELLHLMIEEGFFEEPEHLHGIENFSVQFDYRFHFTLDGGRAFQFEKFFMFQRVLQGWSGYFYGSRAINMERTTFSNFIYDAVKCWFIAFKNIRPELVLWKMFSVELLPFNYSKWPVKIHRENEFLLNKLENMTEKDAKQQILNINDKVTSRFLQMKVRGMTEEEIRKTDINEEMK